MTLKAVFSDPTDSYRALTQHWDKPPADGTSLAEFYAWEERRVDAMRHGGANPFCYVWVPETSISLSRREAASLDVAGFQLSLLQSEAQAVQPFRKVRERPISHSLHGMTAHRILRRFTERCVQLCKTGLKLWGYTRQLGQSPAVSVMAISTFSSMTKSSPEQRKDGAVRKMGRLLDAITSSF